MSVHVVLYSKDMLTKHWTTSLALNLVKGKVTVTQLVEIKQQLGLVLPGG